MLLLAFRVFHTPLELMAVLTPHLHHPTAAHAHHALMFLERWVLSFWYDFAESLELQEQAEAQLNLVISTNRDEANIPHCREILQTSPLSLVCFI